MKRSNNGKPRPGIPSQLKKVNERIDKIVEELGPPDSRATLGARVAEAERKVARIEDILDKNNLGR